MFFGYLLYLVAIILPGLGVSLLLGVWRKDNLLVENLGYVVGLGLAVDTLVLFVGSSGVTIASFQLRAVTLSKFYALLAIGVASLLASAIMRRNRITLPRPSLYDGLVLIFILIQAGVIFLFFTKYPIFPEYNSADFRGHVDIVQSLTSGGTSFPGGLLYYGVHYQLALGVLLTGGIPLIVVQRIGAILAILGTPVVFLAGSRILASRQAGLISSFLYSLTGSIWFGSLFNTGLYPNFFGILASLFVLTLVADVVRDGAHLGRVLALVGAVGMLYLSHYSDVSIIPAVLAVPLTLFLTRKFQSRSLLPPLTLIIPAGLAVALFPNLGALLSGFLANAGGNVIGGTYLSGLLSPVPVIANMATINYYDFGFVLLLLFSVIFAWQVLKERDALRVAPFVWFLSIVLVAPLNSGAWRLSYVGLVPLLLMASGGLVLLLPKAQKKKRNPYKSSRGVLLGILLILLLAGSWGVTVVSDSETNTQLSAQAQQNVYNSILWLGDNAHGSLLSVSDSRFIYTPQLIGRGTYYNFLSTPAQAIPYARSVGASYIIVTQLVTASVPPVPSLFPWNNFPTASNGNLTLLYTNDDVRIYSVK